MVGLPKYKCNKVVEAGRINNINVFDSDSNTALTLDVDGDYQTIINVDGDYMNRHVPEVGGYYVKYKDGYESFSPAESFEEGYTPMAKG